MTEHLPAADRLRTTVQRERNGEVPTPAAERVVIGDGAAWIWNLAAEQVPGAVEIVDFHHARQHLRDIAKAIYRPDPTWPAGPGTAVPNSTPAGSGLSSLRCPPTSRPRPRRERAFPYAFGNRYRMRYPQFRARSLCVSSGVAEAGCKQIGARLKRAGSFESDWLSA